MSPVNSHFCPGCGTLIEEDDQAFCHQCGAALSSPQPVRPRTVIEITGLDDDEKPTGGMGSSATGEAGRSGGRVEVGNTIAGYRIEALIGAGGMGEVFKARDPKLERLVALKVLPPSLADRPGFKERFADESKSAAAIDHPNILPVFDSGVDGGVMWIANRLVDGSDLREMLDAQAPLSPELVVPLITQLGAALDAAHGVGLVHRDVKPANVLVGSSGNPKSPFHYYLTDFGLTGSSGSPERRDDTQASFSGTAAYASPEQAMGIAVDGRADQYSLACLAFEALTGTRPFTGGDDRKVLEAQVSAPVPRISAVNPNLPAGLDEVFSHALAKDPGVRYPTCTDFASAVGEAFNLDALVSAEAMAAAGKGPVSGRRRAIRAAAIVGAAAVVAAGATIGVTQYLDRGDDTYDRSVEILNATNDLSGDLTELNRLGASEKLSEADRERIADGREQANSNASEAATLRAGTRNANYADALAQLRSANLEFASSYQSLDRATSAPKGGGNYRNNLKKARDKQKRGIEKTKGVDKKLNQGKKDEQSSGKGAAGGVTIAKSPALEWKKSLPGPIVSSALIGDFEGDGPGPEDVAVVTASNSDTGPSLELKVLSGTDGRTLRSDPIELQSSGLPQPAISPLGDYTDGVGDDFAVSFGSGPSPLFVVTNEGVTGPDGASELRYIPFEDAAGVNLFVTNGQPIGAFFGASVPDANAVIGLESNGRSVTFFQLPGGDVSTPIRAGEGAGECPGVFAAGSRDGAALVAVVDGVGQVASERTSDQVEGCADDLAIDGYYVIDDLTAAQNAIDIPVARLEPGSQTTVGGATVRRLSDDYDSYALSMTRDLDGDGIPDVLGVDETSLNAALVLGLSDSDYEPRKLVGLPSFTPTAIAVAGSKIIAGIAGTAGVAVIDAKKIPTGTSQLKSPSATGALTLPAGKSWATKLSSSVDGKSFVVGASSVRPVPKDASEDDIYSLAPGKSTIYYMSSADSTGKTVEIESGEGETANTCEASLDQDNVVNPSATEKTLQTTLDCSQAESVAASSMLDSRASSGGWLSIEGWPCVSPEDFQFGLGLAGLASPLPSSMRCIKGNQAIFDDPAASSASPDSVDAPEGDVGGGEVETPTDGSENPEPGDGSGDDVYLD